MYPGNQIKVVDFKQSREKIILEFDEKNLDGILKHPDVVNRKVVVVQIIGALRQGKSFMLAFFLRFLYTTVSEENQPNFCKFEYYFQQFKSFNSPAGPFLVKHPEHGWLGDPNAALQGFIWQYGSIRTTCGIIFWSDVFLTEDEFGEKIAIILVDTQGLYDRKTAPEDNSRIFALSTLISSVKVFYIFSNIAEDTLQYMEVKIFKLIIQFNYFRK